MGWIWCGHNALWKSFLPLFPPWMYTSKRGGVCPRRTIGLLKLTIGLLKLNKNIFISHLPLGYPLPLFAVPTSSHSCISTASEDMTEAIDSFNG